MKEKEKKKPSETKTMKKSESAQKRKAKSFKKVFIICLCAVVGLGAIIFVSLVFSDAYSITHPDKVSAKRFPDDSEIGLYYEAATVKFESGDETVIWFIPAQDIKTAESKKSDITVIFSHDVGDNKTVTKIDDGILYAKQLADAGINVVTFDYSGSGFATGSGYTYGTREANELKQIISYVKEKYGSKYIVLQGWGFGASAAILAGAGNDDVTAVISDAAYTDADKYFNEDGGLKKWSSMPDWTHGLTKFFISVLSEEDMFSAKPINAVSEKNGQAWFFIGEDKDNVFSSDYATALNNAAAHAENETQIWISQKSYHAQAYRTDEKNYVEKVLKFIDKVCR